MKLLFFFRPYNSPKSIREAGTWSFLLLFQSTVFPESAHPPSCFNPWFWTLATHGNHFACTPGTKSQRFWSNWLGWSADITWQTFQLCFHHDCSQSTSQTQGKHMNFLVLSLTGWTFVRSTIKCIHWPTPWTEISHLTFTTQTSNSFCCIFSKSCLTLLQPHGL